MRTVFVALLGVLAVWLLVIVGLAVAGRRSAARELAAWLPHLVVLFRGLLRDDRVPRGSKLWIGFAVAWFLSPIDLVPEFIPVAGPLDDVIVAALVLRHVLRRAGRSVVEEHWRGDPGTLATILRLGRPTEETSSLQAREIRCKRGLPPREVTAFTSGGLLGGLVVVEEEEG